MTGKVLFLIPALALTLAASAAPRNLRGEKASKGPHVRGGNLKAATKPNPKEHNVVREEGKIVVYKKRTVVDFDDSLIEGDVRNPSEFYFVHRPEEKFGTLVSKRKNFHKEMLRDAIMIR